MIEFDPSGPLPAGTTVLEASAGTGKTHTIATLAARYLAEGAATIDQLLLVTFSREASRELRSRVRQRFVELLAGAESAPGRTLDATERSRLGRALLDYDRATIMTIHEFCQAMFAGLGILAGVPAEGTVIEDLEPLLREIAHDLYLARYANDSRLPPFPYQDRLRDRSLQEVGALTLARDALFDPAAELVPGGVGGRAGERVAFGLEVRRETEVRKRRLGVVTFDDLLLRLRDALTDPHRGTAACERLRGRFAVVLVDEFQDTDPVQWDILRAAFDGHRPLVLIGDPKQAIYAFRGADVRSYLSACRTAAHRATLSVNHRADGPLVAALDGLFAGLSLGDGIQVPPVRAKHPGSRVTLPGGRPVVPVRLRTVGDRLPAAEARARVRDDLVAQVRGLLGSGAVFDSPEGLRPLRPNDVAVLVRTNAIGRELTRSLREQGVPVAFSGSDSIFASEAADAWRSLLAAMANPRPAEVRAAMRTPFFGRSLADLARADEDTLGEWVATIRRWERLLSRHGVAALFAAITGETDFTTRILATPGGDRLITDARHLAQVLHEAAGEPVGAAALAEWLAEEAESSSGGAERTRRLETDAHAVQVKTIHKAKGLQFAAVFLPDLADRFLGEDSDRRLVFHDDRDRRVVDLGGQQAPERRARLSAARAEDAEDSLRTLYVALTRARSQVTMWWTRTYNTPASPLHRLLFRDRATSAPEQAYPLDTPPGDGTPEGLPWLVGLPGVSVEPVQPGAAAPPAPDQPAAPDLSARRFTAEIDPHWRRTSYSGLTAAAHGDGWFDLPESLGLDEDERGDDPEEGDAVPATTPMAALPGGTAFGSLVHAVFEELDPQLSAGEDPAILLGRLEPIARRLLPRFPLPDVSPGELAAAMLPSLVAPLGDLVGGRRLADFPARDRLCELDFEMPTAERGGATLRQVAALLDDHLAADDPLADYAAALRSPALGDQPLRGFLTGSIDAVLRFPTPGGPARHVIVDYKTNRLAEGYGPTELAEAMIASHYPLQALLYGVALHRFLAGRLAGYRPEDHLGGALYLFVRGMGSAPGAGVFAWHPPAALIEALSRLLSGEAVA